MRRSIAVIGALILGGRVGAADFGRAACGLVGALEPPVHAAGRARSAGRRCEPPSSVQRQIVARCRRRCSPRLLVGGDDLQHRHAGGEPGIEHHRAGDVADRRGGGVLHHPHGAVELQQQPEDDRARREGQAGEAVGAATRRTRTAAASSQPRIARSCASRSQRRGRGRSLPRCARPDGSSGPRASRAARALRRVGLGHDRDARSPAWPPRAAAPGRAAPAAPRRPGRPRRRR